MAFSDGKEVFVLNLKGLISVGFLLKRRDLPARDRRDVG